MKEKKTTNCLILSVFTLFSSLLPFLNLGIFYNFYSSDLHSGVTPQKNGKAEGESVKEIVEGNGVYTDVLSEVDLAVCFPFFSGMSF